MSFCCCHANTLLHFITSLWKLENIKPSSHLYPSTVILKRVENGQFQWEDNLVKLLAVLNFRLSSFSLTRTSVINRSCRLKIKTLGSISWKRGWTGNGTPSFSMSLMLFSRMSWARNPTSSSSSWGSDFLLFEFSFILSNFTLPNIRFCWMSTLALAITCTSMLPIFSRTSLFGFFAYTSISPFRLINAAPTQTYRK